MSFDQAKKAFSEILSAKDQCIKLFAFADSDIALIPQPPFLESPGGTPPLLTLYSPSGSSSTGLTEYFVPCSSTIEAVTLAAHWLSECFANHLDCPKMTEYPLPLRLVDVGYENSTGDSLRLWLNPYSKKEEDGQRGLYGRYVALSYCWGTRAFTTLTLEREASMINGIDIAEIPQTIRDAIRITRLLGVRYLWVDSLCIYQGTSAKARQDWIEQSQQMGKIYENAILTIGLETARDAYEGFQYTASSITKFFALLPLTWSSSERHNSMFIGPDGALAVNPYSKLHTRGWTFQERLLSTRYITFSSGGMFWECSHGRQYDNACFFHFYDEDLSPKLPVSPTYEDWHLIIEEYSGKQLTNSGDRLVALGGLRTHFLRLRGAQDTDLAGLWRSNLSWDLLWTFGTRGDSTDTDLSDYAPSWSWTSTLYSTNWSISHLYDSRHVCHSKCVSIIDATAKSNLTALEERIEGIIKISGFVSKVEWIISGTSGSVKVVDELGNTVNVEIDKERSYSTELRLIQATGHVPNSLFCVHFHSNPGCIGFLVESINEACTEFRRLGVYRTYDSIISKPNGPMIVEVV